MNRWGFGFLSLGMLLQLPACFIVDDDDGGDTWPGIGSLTLDWTIDGRRDELDCVDFGVDRLEVVIYDRAGRVVEEIAPYCESFITTIDLFEGIYFADVTLVDSFDRSATTTHTIDAIDIIAGTDLAIGIEFPNDSFL